jgi:hypothetical protein
MSIIIERGIDWNDDGDAKQPDAEAVPDPTDARTRRGKRWSASWLISAVAIALAVTTVVTVPTHGPGSHPDAARLPPAVGAVDGTGTSPGELIANPFLRAACDYLFDVAAKALSTDRDRYARSALTVSGTQGVTLNDVVHRDLVAARDAAAQAHAPEDRRPGAVAVLDVAIDHADAAPCSLHSTPPRGQSSWPIMMSP